VLRDINELGLPIGHLFLDLISPLYVADSFDEERSGADDRESGATRIGSGLSSRSSQNGTAANLNRLDAIASPRGPHHFSSVTRRHVGHFRPHREQHCHVILRGGTHTNYMREYRPAGELLDQRACRLGLLIDT